MSERVLVTGATGAVGPTLVRYLVETGCQVTVLSRHLPHPGLLPLSVCHIAGDVRNPDALKQATQAIDKVFNLAAMVHIENPDEGQWAEYEAINVQGALNVAEAACQAGVQRLIQFSTVKVYGAACATPITEAVVPNPSTMYAQSKLKAEQRLLSMEALDVTILRLSPVYGARVRGSWARMVRAIRRGLFLPLGRLNSIHSLSYVDDIAHAAFFLANTPATKGKICNVVTHETPTLHEILSAIYGGMDKRLPPLHIPMPLVAAAAFGLEKGFSLIGGRSPVTPNIVQQLSVDEAYSGAFLRSLGFQPQYSLEEGWRQAIMGMKLSE